MRAALFAAFWTASEAQFNCANTQNTCDGVKDCFDGIDEVQCSEVCGMNQFSCDANNPNTQCIDLQQICNGQRDCSNGLDETNCFQWGQWGSWDASTCSADKCKSQDTCDADCVVIRQRGCFDAYGNPMNVMMDPKCGDRQVLCGDKCGVSAEVKGTCEGCGGFTVTNRPVSVTTTPRDSSGGKCYENSYFDCWWIWLIIVLIIIIILIIILCLLRLCCADCWAACCGCACFKKKNKSSGNLDTLRRNTLVPDHTRPAQAKGTRFEGYDD